MGVEFDGFDFRPSQGIPATRGTLIKQVAFGEAITFFELLVPTIRPKRCLGDDSPEVWWRVGVL